LADGDAQWGPASSCQPPFLLLRASCPKQSRHGSFMALLTFSREKLSGFASKPSTRPKNRAFVAWNDQDELHKLLPTLNPLLSASRVEALEGFPQCNDNHFPRSTTQAGRPSSIPYLLLRRAPSMLSELEWRRCRLRAKQAIFQAIPATIGSYRVCGFWWSASAAGNHPIDSAFCPW
jgi:hypothetical protein